MDEMKRYRCPNGHVVGFIRRDGHGVSRLLFLQSAIDETCETAQQVVVAAIIDSGDVTCSCCGASMVWIPSVPALRRLLESHKQLMDGLRSLQGESQPMNASFFDRG